MVKHPMYCLECKLIFNLHAILFYFIFDLSYIVFISVGLSLFTENQTSCESVLLRAWECVYQGSVSLSNRMQVRVPQNFSIHVSVIVNRSFTKKLAHSSFGVL